MVLDPCRTGEVCACRVIPVSVEPDMLSFDLYLFDDRGEIKEA